MDDINDKDDTLNELNSPINTHQMSEFIDQTNGQLDDDKIENELIGDNHIKLNGNNSNEKSSNELDDLNATTNWSNEDDKHDLDDQEKVRIVCFF